jgi:arginyl-tRNA synthetase
MTNGAAPSTATPLLLRVADAILSALPAGSAATRESIAELLASPPDPALGDLAFPCFKLAKALRKAPPVIASELAAALAGVTPFEDVRPTGPYVNVRLSPAVLAEHVLPPLARGLPPRVANGERVMVEFSQPNTHKAFHVGHMRNLCLGDAIVRLLRSEGNDVIAANYLGDVGAHIAKCLWWYLDVLDPKHRTPPTEGRGEWLGELYSAASSKLDELEEAAKTDELAKEQLAAVRARTTEILKQLEAREPEITAVWMETRSWSLTDFDEIYRWSMVDFDRVFYESEVDEPAHGIVDEYLKAGVFHESDGAIGIVNAEVKHMPFFMLRKRDGTTLYATKDLALARLKFEEHRIDRSIYVVDSRQSDHFRHVFLTLGKMGFAQAKRCEHVPYEMVELTSGAMATRKGNVILFRALRETMLAHLNERYLAKYRGEWPDDEIDRCAHLLALGAIRYGMLSRDVNQKIVFDMDAWLELEGNTGPYLQYTTARFGSILRKGAESGVVPDRALLDGADRTSAVLGALVQAEERELLLVLDGLPRAVSQAASGLRPSVLCAYLHELAKVANRFVNAKQCRVLQSEGDVRTARVLLVEATANALRWGLARLGILSPPRM